MDPEPSAPRQMLQRPAQAIASGAAQPTTQVYDFVRITNRFLQRPEGGVARELEYVVKNGNDRERRYIFVPLPGFLLNLSAWDEDGTRLNFLSDTDLTLQVRAGDALGTIPKPAQDAASKEDRLCIVLPGKGVGKGEYRSILLRFEEESDAPPKWLSLFTVPQQAVQVDVRGVQEEYFLILSAAPEHGLQLSDATLQEFRANGVRWNKSGFQNGRYTASAQFPPRAFSCTFDCTFQPNRSVTMVLHQVFFGVAALVGLGAFFGPWLFRQAWGDLHVDGDVLVTACSFLVAAGLSLILSSSERWMERFKLLVVLPVLLNAAALALHFGLLHL